MLVENDFDAKLIKASGFLKALFAQTQPTNEVKDFSFYGGNVRIKTISTTNYDIQAILSFTDETPMEITVRVRNHPNSYRWVNPYYHSLRQAHFGNFTTPTVEFEITHEQEDWVETETLGDIQNKIQDVRNGKELDGKVEIVLDLDKEELKRIKKNAKRLNLSFDEYIERILLLEIARLDKKQPIE
jgi:hypothetical protein